MNNLKVSFSENNIYQFDCSITYFLSIDLFRIPYIYIFIYFLIYFHTFYTKDIYIYIYNII